MSGKIDIRALTGLRGLAALWVVAYHYRTPPADLTAPLNAAVEHGYLAVDIFFSLSGFVMAMTYAGFFQGRFSPSQYAIFLIRRIARVWPLYAVVTLLIMAGMLRGLGEPVLFTMTVWDFAANLALVQSWGIGFTVDGPAWSVSAELAAYVLFPLLVLLALRSRAILAWITGAACLGAMAWLVTTPAGATTWQRGPLDILTMDNGLPVLRCVAEFTLGLLAYRLARHEWMRATVNSNWVAAALVVALAEIVATPYADYGLVLLAPLLVIALTGTTVLARVVGSRLPYFLGELSYAVYLIHGQLLRLKRIGHARLDGLIGVEGAGLVSLAVFTCVVLVLAYAAFRWIEKPSRNLIRRAELWIRRDAEQQVANSERAGAAGFAETGTTSTRDL